MKDNAESPYEGFGSGEWIDPGDAYEEEAETEDDALDAILAAADQELLEYVRSRTAMNLIELKDAGKDQGLADPTATATATATSTIDELAQSQLCEDQRLGFELTARLTAALDLALDLLLAIPSESGFGHLHEIARSLSLHVTLARDFEPELADSADLAFALDVVPAPGDFEAARMVGRSRHLDFARIIANLTVRGLARTASATSAAAMDIARSVVHALEEAHNLELGQAIVRRLNGISVIDVSGADLSEMRLNGRIVPVGTVWSDKTKWPANMYIEIRAISREIHPGTYRVRTAANSA